MGQGQGGAGRGAGRQPADNSTVPRQETAGEGIPARAQWRRPRRRGSPRNRYTVAKVRWPLRAVWIAAEADAPCPARPAIPARLPHLLCIYRAVQPWPTGDAGMPPLPRSMTSTTYLCDTHAHNIHRSAVAAAAAAASPDAVGDARLFICHNKHENSTRSLRALIMLYTCIIITL